MKKSKKTFKRVLSVALAALMVGSSLPIASLAASDQDIVNLNAAITAYETKMAEAKTGNKVFTNLKPAYDAYIDALEVKDAYTYGDSNNKASLDAATVTNTLTTATNAMTVWDPTTMGTYNAKPSYNDTGNGKYDHDASVYVPGVTHQNILATAVCTRTSGSSKINGSGSDLVEIKIGYPQTILVYDGSANKPKMPVMMQAKNNVSNAKFAADQRYVVSAYPDNGLTDKGDSPYFALDGYWHGSPNTKTYDWTHAYINGDSGTSWHETNGSRFNYSTGFVDNVKDNSHYGINIDSETLLSNAAYHHQANVMTFKYDMKDNEYFYVFDDQAGNESMNWYAIATGSKDSDAKSVRSFATTTPVFVLNIASIKNTALSPDTLAAVANVKNSTTHVADYGAFLAALDKATTFNLGTSESYLTGTAPNNSINTAAATAKGNEIKATVEGINNTKAAFVADAEITGYQALRNELSSQDIKTTLTLQDKYTPETWSAFINAYNAAVDVFTNITTTSYNDDAGAKTKATTLRTAYSNLQTNVKKVDTNKLEIVIDNADVIVVIEHFVKPTQASGLDKTTAMNQLKEAIANAKTAVWTSPDQYKVSANALDDDGVDGQNRATVDNHKKIVANAIKNFELDFNATVPATGKSIDTLVQEASALTPTNYLNYVQTVEVEINNANTFKNGADSKFVAKTKNSVQTVIQKYVEIDKALDNAIKNLQPSFSHLENGTVANPGTIVGPISLKDNMQKETWQIGLKYHQDKVVFRTNHDPADFKLGNFEMTFQSLSSDWAQALDSINLDDQADHANNKYSSQMHSTEWSEITSDKGSVNPSMNQTQKDLFPGNLSITRTVNGVTGSLTVDNIHVTSTTSSVEGRDASGNEIQKGTNYNWANDLATTDGIYVNDDVSYKGGILASSFSEAKGQPVRIVASQKVTLPAVTADPLSAATRPQMITFAPENTYFGAVVKYKIKTPGFGNVYQGFGHDRMLWSPSVSIIDVSYLFDLINEANKLNPDLYTPQSFTVVEQALVAANADFDYSVMTPQAITTECQTRYDNLWNAYAQLERVAHVHDYQNPKYNGEQAKTHTLTCTNADGQCNQLEKTENCTFNEGVVTTPATCTTPGVKTYTCSVCGGTYTEEIPATDHNFGAWKYNGNKTHSRTCQNPNCKEKQTDNCTFDGGVITKQATCNAEGVKTYTCSVCHGTYTESIPATGNHQFGGKPVYNGNSTHKYTCTECGVATQNEDCTPFVDPYVAPTAKNPKGKTEGSHCSVCGGVIKAQETIDATAYFAAIEEANTIKNDPDYSKKYTESARKEFEKTINDNTLVFTPAPGSNLDEINAAINNATTNITEAQTTLNKAPKGYTVKLQKIVNGVESPAQEVAVNQPYATVYTADATALKGTGFISSWAIYDESTKGTTPIHSNADTVEFTITSNTTVKVYIADKPQDAKTYTKVTLYNELGSVYNVSYVENTDGIDLSQETITIGGNQFKAPARPFYTFTTWTQVPAPTGEMKIVPKYSFIEQTASYSKIYSSDSVAMINGVEQFTSKYDKLITLSGGEAYAMVDATGQHVINYIRGNQIHAPHNDAPIYIKAVSLAEVNSATSAVTGTLVKDMSAYYGDGMRAATFNCMFNLPEGSTLVECGAVGTNKYNLSQDTNKFVIGGKNVFKFKSDSHSKMNEYNIMFIANFPSQSVFYGRSYIIYDDAQGTRHTVYSDVNSIAL